jgi:hypothetical protein
MSADNEKERLIPEEQQFIERLATHYSPLPLTAARRKVLDRDLQERIAHRRPLFFRPIMLAATACASVFIWMATGNYRIGFLDSQQAVTPRPQTEYAIDQEDASLLLFAYDDTELYGDEADDEDENFLPDEYEALTTALFPADV